MPQALFFIATALLVGALGTRMWNRKTGLAATLAYATMLGPYIAGSVLTPDTPLAAFLAATYYGFWRASERGGTSNSGKWWLFVGLAMGLAFLTKGPAALVFCPPMLAYLAFRAQVGSTLRSPAMWGGVGIALALAAAWYVPISVSLPGAVDYLFDNQVSGRLVATHYNRNPGLEGAAKIYLPALLLGPFPWFFVGTRYFTKWGAQTLATLREQKRLTLAASPTAVFLACWFVLPAMVLIAASSHLPLYVLPLFAPMALASARAFERNSDSKTSGSSKRHGPLLAFALWSLFIVGLRGGVGGYPTRRDTRATARWLADQNFPSFGPVLLVDAPLEGLSLYGYHDLISTTIKSEPYPLFVPLPRIDEALFGMRGKAHLAFAVVGARHKRNPILQAMQRHGFRCELGSPHEKWMSLVCERPEPANVAFES